MFLLALVCASSSVHAAVITVDFELTSNMNISPATPIGAPGTGVARLSFNAQPGGSATATTVAPGFVNVLSITIFQPVSFNALNTLGITGTASFMGGGQAGYFSGGGGLNINGSGSNGGIGVMSTLHCGGAMVSFMLCTDIFGLPDTGTYVNTGTGLKVKLDSGTLGTTVSGTMTLLTFRLGGPAGIGLLSGAFGYVINGTKNQLPAFFAGSYGGQTSFLIGTEIGRTFVPEPGSFSLVGLGLGALGLGAAARGRMRRRA